LLWEAGEVRPHSPFRDPKAQLWLRSHHCVCTWNLLREHVSSDLITHVHAHMEPAMWRGETFPGLSMVGPVEDEVETWSPWRAGRGPVPQHLLPLWPQRFHSAAAEPWLQMLDSVWSPEMHYPADNGRSRGSVCMSIKPRILR
jgi:hypothetical protein